MFVKIENLTNRLVSLPLNSGNTLHLPPRFTSQEIMESEVDGNKGVDRLLSNYTIAMHRIVEKQEGKEVKDSESGQPSGDSKAVKKAISKKS